jgi:hemolysin activation/secretion protein
MNHWKKFLLLCLCVGLSATSTPRATAQTVVSPITEPAPVTEPAPAQPTPAVPGAVRLLRQLIIVESSEEAQKFTPPLSAGFVVLSPTLSHLNLAELTKRLATGEGRAIDERILAAVAQVVEVFARQSEYPKAVAIIPTQSIAEGLIRVVLQLGEKSAPAATITPSTEFKIRKITMSGTRWFSESLLREKLRIEQGSMVRATELMSSINWTNNNPFRQVKVHLEPVANTSEADLTITVQEAMPLRLLASVDNGGNDLIGNNRFTGSVSYGNLWGLDHQLSYQFITTNEPDVFKGHGLDYRVPLPWRHYFQMSGSYLKARPTFYEGLLQQNGETITSDLRYTIPLRTGDNTLDVYGQFSFKQSNNNLNWDPQNNNVQVLSTKTDIFQFTFGGTSVLRDKRGAWALGASITASPGDINSRNTDKAYDGIRHGGEDSARIGAKSSYAFASITVQRLQKLAPGWDLFSRGVVQLSQANLLPSEQITIGGSNSVRGYNENVFAGDHGYVLSTDLMAPSWKISLPGMLKKRGPLEARFLAFFDAAHTSVRHAFPGDQKRTALASQGIGLRMSYSNNFSLSADYGWQLTDLPYQVDERSRSHIKATLAF